MKGMFEFCENLTSIDLSSSLNAKNLKSIDMSNPDKQLKDINISTFNTEKVKNMSGMFYNCTNLKSITFSSAFNTKSVTDMTCMFSGLFIYYILKHQKLKIRLECFNHVKN